MLSAAAQLAEMHNTHNGDESGQSHKARFEEVTKMWSGMNEEEKRAYTEDFKVASLIQHLFLAPSLWRICDLSTYTVRSSTADGSQTKY